MPTRCSITELGTLSSVVCLTSPRPDYIHRRQLILMAVPESIDPDDTSVTVKALIDNDLLAGLVEVLEKRRAGVEGHTEVSPQCLPSPLSYLLSAFRRRFLSCLPTYLMAALISPVID